MRIYGEVRIQPKAGCSFVRSPKCHVHGEGERSLGAGSAVGCFRANRLRSMIQGNVKMRV